MTEFGEKLSDLLIPAFDKMNEASPPHLPEALYVDAGQAAIMRDDGQVKALATDKVCGCIGMIARNEEEGTTALIHVLANFDNGNMEEEWETLIRPTLESLSQNGGDIKVQMFGGVYRAKDKAAGAHFVETITNRLAQEDGVTITDTKFGNTPHPTAIVVERDGTITPASEEISTHKQVVDQVMTGQGKTVDLSSFAEADVDPLFFGIIHNEAHPKTPTPAPEAEADEFAV